MLALVDYKYVRTNPFRRAPKIMYDTVFGLRVLRLTAEINRKTGRCDKSARVLKQANADMVCFIDGFPSRAHFNVREPESVISYEKLLPQLIERHDLRGESVLLVAGADPRSGDMLRLLSQRYRYVLTCGFPGSALRRLQQQIGASVIAEPSEEKIATAELAVFLRGCEAISLPPECVVLAPDMRLTENIEYTRYIELPELNIPHETPAGFDRRILLSEAIRRGAMAIESLMIGNSQILTKQHK